MPSKQRFLRKDPNGLGRGSGRYYLRGGKTKESNHSFTLPSGKVIKGPYYSKYSESIDKATKSKGYKNHKVGMPKKAKTNLAHVTDGNIFKNMTSEHTRKKQKKKKKKSS